MLSIIAIVLSLLSLAWQTWTWSRSGPVLRVESAAIITDAGNLVGEAELFIQVRVSNRGRSAATITGWGIEAPGGGSLFQLRPLGFSTKLPARVESHSDASFYMPVDGIREQAARQRIPSDKLRAWAQPASGKKVYARKPVPVA